MFRLPFEEVDDIYGDEPLPKTVSDIVVSTLLAVVAAFVVA